MVVKKPDHRGDDRLFHGHRQYTVVCIGSEDTFSEFFLQQNHNLLSFHLYYSTIPFIFNPSIFLYSILQSSTLHFFLNSLSLNSVFFEQSFVFGRIPSSQSFRFHEVLDLHDTVEYLLRPWRTTGHVYVNRNNAIDTLEYAVRIENSSAAGTGAYGKYPTRFCHLFIHLTKDGSHLLRDRTHYHEQVRLAR